MRIRTPRLLGAIILVGASLSSNAAQAQSDTNIPPPNVMLLVDSSGSMEYMASNDTCTDTSEPCFPKCYPAVTDTTKHEKSRWIDLLEVLTGSVDDYACWEQDRSTTDFRDEFKLGSVDAYDANGKYALPYHRALSALCAPGPGTLPSSSNPYEYPTGGFGHHPYSASLGKLDRNSSCTFSQSSDGLLDSLKEQIRFGLMTFDTKVDPGDGLGAGGIADYSDGVDGTWSYFLSTTCQTIPPSITTNYCAGRPDNCSTTFPEEVGARNAAAPPWEGRMVGFGPPNATTSDMTTRNEWIQNVLLSTRPYGATPIAGMMHDAEDFFWNDTSTDPLNSGQKFGPKDDPLVTSGCRRNVIVLLSDGEPNLDLRPYCESGTGICPYDTPENIAYALANATPESKRVRVYAVGFGITKVDPEGDGTFTNCEDLASTTYCSDPKYSSNRELQACCTLNAVALNGTPLEDQGKDDVLDHALFADDPDDLRSALAQVFSEALDEVTTRTHPVFTTATGTGKSARGFQFFSAVNVRSVDLWQGELKRKRLVCGSDGKVDEQGPDEAKGDDFIANVNSGLGDARRFYTVNGAPDGSIAHNARSIRPNLSGADDGLGTYSGEVVENQLAADFVVNVTAESLDVTGTTCSTARKTLSATDCKNRYMNWLVGLNNGTLYNRCKTPGSSTCNLVADILHSTPQVRGRPDEFLRDESYSNFAATYGDRDTVMYTSSNDGFFHAFKVAPGEPAPAGKEVATKSNNEMWAFIPPAVLPSVPSEYPNVHQRLLDGAPVIKDVVATEVKDPTTTYDFRLERTRDQALAGGGTWRTIVVQSFGPSRGGYFALDVTQPKTSADNGGPKFLWQLTQDDKGKEIFGTTGTTPLVTTVFMDTKEVDNPVREVAVAVLPGGDGGSATDTATVTTDTTADPSAFNPRTTVRRYRDTASVGARSLTIVRLDSGEVIRTFRPKNEDLIAGFDAKTVTYVDIPAPIVGEPAAFPAQTGVVADRLFVGDREGRIWRVDLTDTDPSKWSMDIFFDAYSKPTDPAMTAEPIVTAPVLSVDDAGNITVNFSTGDQEILTQTDGMQNYAYSLTEMFTDAGKVQAKVNWRHIFSNGDRVMGPMALFDRKLFFSTFTPGAETSCEEGESKVYGVNYIVPKDETDLDQGGQPALPPQDGSTELVQSWSPLDGIVYGVGLRQEPSCSLGDDLTAGDPYLGFGKTTTTTLSNPGKFQLVVQIGGSKSVAAGEIDTQTFDLQNPSSPVHIDSWTLLLE